MAGGGSAARQQERNMHMASEMKRLGITRTTGRCPICHHVVALRGMFNHIISCKGR